MLAKGNLLAKEHALNKHTIPGDSTNNFIITALFQEENSYQLGTDKLAALNTSTVTF